MASFTSPPPLLSVPQMYAWHARHNPDHPLFIHDEEVEGSDEYQLRTITWGTAGSAIERGTRIISDALKLEGGKGHVVAVVGSMDQQTYFTITASLLILGLVPFPISPRNSQAAVKHLLKEVGVAAIIATATAELDDESRGQYHILPGPTFSELYTGEASTSPLTMPETPDMYSVALILHSSGSTSFPKPIRMTHRTLVQSGSLPKYGEVDVCGKILSSHSLPYFHAMGVLCHQWATTSGLILSNFAPSGKQKQSTPDSVYISATRAGSNLIFCVPTFLESWSADPERVQRLAQFDAVLFGGAPIQKAVGDFLYEKGVKIFPFYGATEIGGCCVYLQKNVPVEGWEYFKVSKHCDARFEPYDSGEENVYRIIFKACETHRPSTLNHVTGETGDEKDAFDTNDLIIGHPTSKGLWKVHGRADDQIMHSTGEKTNPVPMENIINKHPAVSSCLMFGRGKFEAGVLIEPTPEHKFDPSDEKKLEEFRNQVWPAIEAANTFGPSHSRIFKEIILVTHPNKPFQFTPKGTPRRHVILNDYAAEVEEGYRKKEESAQTDIPAPVSWSKSEVLTFIREAVRRGMDREIGEEEDFFQAGCDSLKATWIRNTILHALRDAKKVNTKKLPGNFVYMYPTTSKLAKYIYKVVDGPSSKKDKPARAAVSKTEIAVEA